MSAGKRRASSSTGTLRLFIAFGAGIIGVLYLIIAVSPITSGRFELNATVTDIETMERDGLPEARYLEVRNGNIVLEYAEVWLSKRDGESRLFQITAPVVSDAQLAAWKQSREAGEPLDLSRLRLVVRLDGDRVEELWPEVKRRAEAEEPLDHQPSAMTLTGETVIAKGQLNLPTFPPPGGKGLDWSNARRLSYGVNHDSLGNLLKNLAIAIALLAISFFTFRHHRRNPTKPSPGGLDLTPVFDDTLDL